MSIGAAVLRLRKARSMRQVDLAAHARVSQPHLCAVEKGQRVPSLSVTERIACALGLPMWVLFAGEDPSSPARRLADELYAASSPGEYPGEYPE